MNTKILELDEHKNPNGIYLYSKSKYCYQEESKNDFEDFTFKNVNVKYEKNSKTEKKGKDNIKEDDIKQIGPNMNDINELIKNNLPPMNNPSKFEIIKKEKKKCGRKRIRIDENRKEHNKYSDDNIRTKCKHMILKYLLEFINNKIKNIYNGNIGKGMFIKELQTLNQSQITNRSITYNQNFLGKKLGDILGDKISGKFRNYWPEHNKLLIDKLMNEQDETKKNYFNKLFNINFLQCLKHFIGEYTINELEGLTCFHQIKNDIVKNYPEDGEEYFDYLDYYLKNFEEIINNKKPRKNRK